MPNDRRTRTAGRAQRSGWSLPNWIDAEHRALPFPRTTLLMVAARHPEILRYWTPTLGRLATPQLRDSIDLIAHGRIEWAADNDAFSGFDADAYIGMIDRLQYLPGCRFVTVPDAVGDAAETARLWREWAVELHARGLPAAYVAQDGACEDSIPWGELSALFIGGTTEWKLGPAAADLARAARRRAKWVHWGRVNSYRRIRYVQAIGADSIDGGQWSLYRRAHLRSGLAACAQGRQLTLGP